MAKKIDSEFPHMEPVSRTDSTVLFRNDVYPVSLLKEWDAASPDASVSYTVSLEREAGAEPEVLAKTQDLSVAREAYAKAWLQSAALDINLGFHPDTRAKDYTPPLRPELAAQYDAMISYAFECLEDPYAVSWESWVEAGLVENGPSL